MEEKNLNEEKINESNAAKRIRLLGIDDSDKIHDSEIIIKKGNFFGNFWYQHKWAFIISTCFIAIAVYFIVSIVSQPSYDMYIAYAGPLYPDYDTHYAIEKAFTDIARDYDEDGEKLLNFASLTYQNDEQRKQSADEMMDSYGMILQTSENYKSRQAIASQMLSGTVAIYLMDEALYKEYESGMVKLSTLGIEGLDPTIMVGESGVYFKKTEFYHHMYATEWGRALKNIPDDTVLCILPELVTMDEDLYKSSSELIKTILEFGN